MNLLISPLLNQINQERVYFLKKLSAKTIVELLNTLTKSSLPGPTKKIINIVVQMIEEPKSQDT